MKTSSALILFVAASVAVAADTAEKTHKLTSVSMRKMADSLHAVIAGDQQETAGLLERQMNSGGTNVPVLPSHAQLLRAASARIQRGGAEFSYTLRSLWPIDRKHGPQTEYEQLGMESVARRPDTNYYAEETLGGRSYFTAIYASRAALQSCVDCHNRDPRSARHDFRTNDVMRAIVIRIPLEF